MAQRTWFRTEITMPHSYLQGTLDAEGGLPNRT